MAKTADTIAIYSRKSRYTGKGESIGNQIDLCREYIRTHYGDGVGSFGHEILLMPDETALRELSEQVIEKLKRLTDAEFAGLEFPMN